VSNDEQNKKADLWMIIIMDDDDGWTKKIFIQRTRVVCGAGQLNLSAVGALPFLSVGGECVDGWMDDTLKIQTRMQNNNSNNNTLPKR
jgi:hypothetical protein